MTDGELTEFFDLIDGFMAYDCGATDSGIKDDSRRAEAMEFLNSLDRDTRLLLIGRYLWHYDEEMGGEDEASTLEWFRDQGLI